MTSLLVVSVLNVSVKTLRVVTLTVSAILGLLEIPSSSASVSLI